MHEAPRLLAARLLVCALALHATACSGKTHHHVDLDASVGDGGNDDGGTSDAGVPLMGTDVAEFTSAIVDAWCGGLTDGCIAGYETRSQTIRFGLDVNGDVGTTCRSLLLDQLGERTQGEDFAGGSEAEIFDALGATFVATYLGGVRGDLADFDFDASAATACAASVRSLCLDLPDLLAVPACRQVFDGRVALGSTCSDDADCDGDAYCTHEVLQDGTCTRSVCTARAAASAPCDASEDGCSAGTTLGTARCGYSGGATSVCAIVPLHGGVGPGGSCGHFADRDDRCSAGSYCQFASGEGGFCTPVLAQNAPCQEYPTPATACARGLACGTVGGTDRCVPVSRTTSVSAPCEGSAPGVGCDSSRHLVCVTASQSSCQLVGDGTLGASCRGELTHSDCNPGLRCTSNLVDGYCVSQAVPLAPAGEACDLRIRWTQTCQVGLACRDSLASGVCAAPPLDTGFECTATSECASGLFCTSYFGVGGRICTPPRPDGAACGDDVECESADCTAGFCGGKPTLWPCTTSSECASGLCQFSVCTDVVGTAESCANSFTICAPTDFCVQDSATCVTKRADGDSCAHEPGECQSGFCDSASGNTCQPALAIGASCAISSDACGERACRADITDFATATCRAFPLANGVECAYSAECSSGRCATDAGSGHEVCTASLPLGGSCSYDAECSTGTCGSGDSGFECGPKLPDGSACRSDSNCLSGTCGSVPGLAYSVCAGWADACFDRTN